MQTIDLKKVAAIGVRFAADRIKNVVLLKSSADGRFLYYYKLYTFIENGKASTLTEAQVTEKLKAYQDMPVTMWHDNDKGDVLPKPLQGREDLVKRQFESFDDIKAYILAESGVEVTGEQLGDDITLHLRASAGTVTKATTFNLGRVKQIIGLLNGQDTTRKTVRLFCAFGYPVNAAQRSFGLKVRALVNRINGR